MAESEYRTLTCGRCAGELPAGRKRWCSTRCRDGTNMTRAEYRESVRAGAAGSFTCEHCGKPAFRNLSGTGRAKGSRNRFCSMACRVAQAAERERLVRARRSLLSALRKVLRAKEQQQPTPPRIYTPVVRVCRHCGLHWSALLSTGWTRTPYCPTPECQAARTDARRLIRQRHKAESGKSHDSRARKLGRKRRKFNLLRILERDGWRCQLCGAKTPKALRGTTDQRAPEIDHIVPLAAGGDHVPENCQCACRQCNSAKGAKPLGQMLLIG